MAFKWSREQIEKLIYCVEQNSCIYNLKSVEYLDRKKKAQAFNTILKEMQKMDSTLTLEEIKRRWKNLRTQYRKEVRCIKLSRIFGRADLYVPKLWCFGHLHFLTTHSNIEERKPNTEEAILKKDSQKCRVCMKENAELDWNDFLYNQNLLTYKDCYYKYTRLNCFDGDNFPTMLCRICSNSLECIETFISKAIETHNLLLRNLPFDISYKEQNDTEQEDSKFEMNFVEETDIKPDVQDISNIDEEFLEETKEIETLSICRIHDTALLQTRTLKSPSKQDLPINFEEFPLEAGENETSSISELSDNALTQTRVMEKSIEIQNECIEESTEQMLKVETLFEKKKERRKQPICCTICSKVLSSKYKAIKHEEIHKNRERNESCDECGLRFYKKESLASHKLTHIENREKNQKCEFCDKTFYHKGALNVHRRIHLGQMIPCTLCTKEFYRQIDLDNHMAFHSATPIHSDIKIKKKIFVCCEYCGENVRSINYKSHTARHTNVHLFRCAICNKGFFSRDSCNKHLRKTHKKGNAERSRFVIACKPNRCSNLFMQQRASKIFMEE